MSTRTQINAWVIFFILALAAAGISAFPLEAELRFASDVLHGSFVSESLSGLVAYIDQIRDAVISTNGDYPFLAYGTDWLAFAHLVIAVAFIGVLRDPVRNVWIIQWGMIACVMVIPTVLIAGAVRGIPWPWQLIDMSFGVFGIIPLVIVWRLTMRLEREQQTRVAEM